MLYVMYVVYYIFKKCMLGIRVVLQHTLLILSYIHKYIEREFMFFCFFWYSLTTNAFHLYVVCSAKCCCCCWCCTLTTWKCICVSEHFNPCVSVFVLLVWKIAIAPLPQSCLENDESQCHTAKKNNDNKNNNENNIMNATFKPNNKKKIMNMENAEK